MPIPLYLDAARMGRMSPSTRLALQEFVRFAGEYGATLYFDDFLKNGFRALPGGLQESHAGLSSWRGMGEFQESLSALVGLGKNRLPLLANRTANLVKLGAKTLFAGRRRVLMSDLTWPGYAEIMRKKSAWHGSQLAPSRRHPAGSDQSGRTCRTRRRRHFPL